MQCLARPARAFDQATVHDGEAIEVGGEEAAVAVLSTLQSFPFV